MSFLHGVYTSEKASSMVAPVTASASLPVVVGTAPINLAESYLVNEPVLCFDYEEATKKLGFSNDFKNYTLCESMYSQFALYGIAPVVFINVLDPTKHKKKEQQPLVFIDGKAVVKTEGVLKESLKLSEVKDGEGQPVEDAEVELAFDDDGFLNIHAAKNVKEAVADFDKLDPTMVTSDEIVGGVSVDGSYKGLELVSKVFPLFRLVPGTIICPKYSTDPLVAAVMEAKSQHINGVFQAISIPDISTIEVKDYTKVAKAKNDNNIASTYQVPTWPMISLGGKPMHLSTQLASLLGAVDAENEGVPHVSPSNKNLKMDSAILADGTPVVLGLDQSNYLNGQGIVTTLNFIGGHKLWGNRTAAYPANSDAKDAFIPLRRMFNYVANSLVLTYWNKVDVPGDPKLIESVIRSVNTWLDGLTAEGKLLGGRVEFRKELNPPTALSDGKFKFSIFLTPPTPAEVISFELELDHKYFEALFAS
ncbi:MAG TPA: phage tail sheath family protein [Metalysinibacillus sp.]